ncbi:hypothetical protein [Paradesulfitobacterium ferrireducens]|uniref:hypothetical protein n=1 Tax=Paradesulfitobacterium ferrireducens TaxID=2816476 RepID=UPI001A8E1910|nr:hypothetical protein [Paradesulfitobacterium ferrireducens]
MLILIKMHNSVSWYHNPKDFSLVVNVGKTVFEIMELIGVEANSKTKVKLNGNVVSLGNLVSDGDEMEIFLVDETLVGSGSD